LHRSSLNLAWLADGVFVVRSKLAFEYQFTCSFGGERGHEIRRVDNSQAKGHA
jgi:hypothetical protein